MGEKKQPFAEGKKILLAVCSLTAGQLYIMWYWLWTVLYVLTHAPLFTSISCLLLIILYHLEPGLHKHAVKTGDEFGEADGEAGDEEDQWWEDELLCLSVCSVYLLLSSLWENSHCLATAYSRQVQKDFTRFHTLSFLRRVGGGGVRSSDWGKKNRHFPRHWVVMLFY